MHTGHLDLLQISPQYYKWSSVVVVVAVVVVVLTACKYFLFDHLAYYFVNSPN